MATTATTTGQSTEADHDVFALLCDLTRLQLTWSFEGTMEAEATIRRVATHCGAQVDVAMFADAAMLTVGERTISFSRAPIVPPLDQVSAFKELLDEIDTGRLGLFATGFGISV
jgi:hypothetical protein